MTAACARAHVLAPLIYLALGLALLPLYRHVHGQDEVFYIAIAEHYARGDFATAVNAHWGPLLSWLLAGLLVVGLPSVLAAKLLSLGIGLFTFYAARSLATQFEMSDGIRHALSLLVIPILLYCSLPTFFADLLMAGLLTWYLSVILSRRYLERPAAGLACGGLGALAYLCKGYGFAFFLGHFGLMTLFQLAAARGAGERRAVVLHGVAGLTLFLALAGCWVYALTQRYHYLTIGITGKLNYAMFGPDSRGYPSHAVGLMPPPHAASISVWEDPTAFYSYPEARTTCLKPWTPFESRRAFLYQSRLIRDNAQIAATAYNACTFLAATIIVGCLLLSLDRRQGRTTRGQLALALFTLVAYPALYTLVHMEERYLWSMWLLILALGGYLLDVTYRQGFLPYRAQRTLLAVLFGISFLITPISGLALKANNLRELQILGALLEGEDFRGAKIASHPDLNGLRVSYNHSVCVAHQVGATYYGMPKKNLPAAELTAELRKNGIKYYLVWYGALPETPGLEKVKDLTQGDMRLTVYAVKQ